MIDVNLYVFKNVTTILMIAFFFNTAKVCIF